MDTTDRSGDCGLFHELQFDRRSIAGEVVIQEIPSQLYLSEEDFLTLEIAGARRFKSCSAALEETAHLKLKSAQLVMDGESREWEILPVGITIIL